MTPPQSSPVPDPEATLVPAPDDASLDALAREAEASTEDPGRARIPTAPPSFFGLLPVERRLPRPDGEGSEGIEGPYARHAWMTEADIEPAGTSEA